MDIMYKVSFLSLDLINLSRLLSFPSVFNVTSTRFIKLSMKWFLL